MPTGGRMDGSEGIIYCWMYVPLPPQLALTTADDMCVCVRDFPPGGRGEVKIVGNVANRVYLNIFLWFPFLW